MTRNCELCGASILHLNNSAKFCGEECYAASHFGWAYSRTIRQGENAENSLESVGQSMGVTRERVRQLETSGMRKALLLLNDLALDEGADCDGLTRAELRELSYLKERERELAKDIVARSPEMAERLGIAKAKSKDQIRMAEYRKAKREGRAA